MKSEGDILIRLFRYLQSLILKLGLDLTAQTNSNCYAYVNEYSNFLPETAFLPYRRSPLR
jgi:hypothetical protein